MRALLAGLILLAAPTAAAAKPLDLDRSFARKGVLRLDEPRASYSVLATRDGGTLHVTDSGVLRVTARGRVRSIRAMTPAGAPRDVVAAGAGALVVGNSAEPYDQPWRLAVWRLGADGATLAHHEIAMPAKADAIPLRVVRRGKGYAALVETAGSGNVRRVVVVALTRDGALDATWGDDGFRVVPRATYEDRAIAATAAGGVHVLSASSPRCEVNSFDGGRERALVRVQRFDPAGTPLRRRSFRAGSKMECPASLIGDVRVDRRGRTTFVGAIGSNLSVFRLRADGRRDRSFGDRGEALLDTVRPWIPPRLAPRPGGGYGVAYTEDDGVPRGHVALVDARGRSVRTRRLRTFRSFPTSTAIGVAFDRRGRLVAAGALNDTDLDIREDYGQPHFAAWRLKTR